MPAGAMIGNCFCKSGIEVQNSEVQDAGGVDRVVGPLDMPDPSTIERMVVIGTEASGDVGVTPSVIVCEYR